MKSAVIIAKLINYIPSYEHPSPYSIKKTMKQAAIKKSCSFTTAPNGPHNVPNLKKNQLFTC